MPLNKEQLKKQLRGRPDFYEVREGLNLLRVLPPTMKYFTEEINYIALRVLTHWGLGPEGSPPLTCPRTHDPRAVCPICEKVRASRKDSALKELVDALYARERFLFNVIDVDHPEKGIQKLETGPKIHGEIVKVAVDPDYGDVLDLDAGRNFKVTKIPESKTHTGFVGYEVLAAASVSSIKDKLPQDWKAKIEELASSIPEIEEEESLRALLDGGVTTKKTEKPKEEKPKEEKPKEEKPKEPEKPTPTPPTSANVTPKEEPKLSGEKKACFGKEYSPSREACKKCETKKECATAYVSA